MSDSQAVSSFDVARAAEAVGAALGEPPEVLLVLGSGLGGLVELVEDAASIPFSEVPGFPPVGVKGHSGRYVAGSLDGRRVLIQAGRFHLYEGLPMELVCAPVRIAAALGVKACIFTNAAGGISRELHPGSLMLIDDHINLQWRSALAGPVADGDERFPDMSAPYDAELQRLAVAAALELGERLERGTYAAVMGPSYETPAEVRMLAKMGADAVGMSTVPEVITARAVGLPCLGFSLITNHAAGLSLELLDHDDVMAVGAQAGVNLSRIIRRVLSRIQS